MTVLAEGLEAKHVSNPYECIKLDDLNTSSKIATKTAEIWEKARKYIIYNYSLCFFVKNTGFQLATELDLSTSLER